MPPSRPIPPERQRVLIEVDKDLLKRIDHISIDWDVYRKEAIERLLAMAVQKVEQESRREG